MAAKKKCYYCGKVLGKKNKSIDHLIPRCKGGTDSKNNLVDACKKCNEDKNGLLLDEYRAVVAYRKGLIKLSLKFYGEST